MQLSFGRSDSFYKIFKSFEKLPDNKKVTIYIHPENQFFQNSRRGEQLMQLMEEKNIQFEFISNTNTTDQYFGDLGAPIHKPKITFDYKKFLNVIYMFFFRIKDFHLYIVNKKNISRYLIISLEILIMLLIVYGIYSVTIPRANVYIYPSYNSEEIMYNFRYYDPTVSGSQMPEKVISIPYKNGVLKYNYTMSTTVKNIRYLQNPSRGQVKIYNTTSKTFALKPNTKLITDNGLIFRSTSWIQVEGGNINKPSEIIVDVEALDTDIKKNIIGQRGNISQGTKLLIQNLRDSFISRTVYAEAFTNFTGGETNSEGTITEQDIESFSGKVTSYISDNQKEILIKELQSYDIKPLLFDDLVETEAIKLNTSQKVGSDSPTIEGTMTFNIKYKYIEWSDINNAVNQYLTQRPSDSVSLVDIDKSTITFFDKSDIGSGLFIIPTKINTVWGYNFESDVSNIKNTIIEKITNKDEEEAKKVILGYPDVADVDIKLSPFWIQNIPGFKSNIHIYNGRN